MVSPVFNTFVDGIASFLESSEGKIVKISSSFEKKFGYKEEDLINTNVIDFIKNDSFHLDKNIIEEQEINFFKTNIKTKWGVSKESIVVKASIDFGKDIFIFKDNYNSEDL